MATGLAADSGVKVAVATVALLDLDESTTNVLRDCFRQFNIQVMVLPRDQADRLKREKFEALALALDDKAAAILEMARTSKSNSRIVIYGVCAGVQEALRYSKFGINAVLDTPVDRQAALRVVRSTHLLVLHEFRRYVRIPVVIEVAVESGTERFKVTTCEISAGGMSVRTTRKMELNQSAELSFDLPNVTGIKVRTTLCWIKSGEEMVGMRFDSDDERRLRVREWIDDYLGI